MCFIANAALSTNKLPTEDEAIPMKHTHQGIETLKYESHQVFLILNCTVNYDVKRNQEDIFIPFRQ